MILKKDNPTGKADANVATQDSTEVPFLYARYAIPLLAGFWCALAWLHVEEKWSLALAVASWLTLTGLFLWITAKVNDQRFALGLMLVAGMICLTSHGTDIRLDGVTYNIMLLVLLPVIASFSIASVVLMEKGVIEEDDSEPIAKQKELDIPDGVYRPGPLSTAAYHDRYIHNR